MFRITQTLRAKLALAAALLSLGAAGIHASVAEPHFDHYVPFGLLFVASALAQTAWAGLVVVAPSRRAFAAGAVGNAAIAVVWALSRTAGVPFGPDPWTPEPVAALDLAATVFEVAIVAASGILLAADRFSSVSGPGMARFAAVGATVVAGLTGTAFAATPGGAAGHHHGPATAHGAAHRHATAPDRPAPRASSVASRRAAKRPKSAPHSHAESTPHSHAAPHDHS